MVIKHDLLILLNRCKFKTKKWYVQLKMALGLYDKSNKIILVKRNGERIIKKRMRNVQVSFKGKNNIIEIQEPYHIKKINCLFRGDNNTLIIKNNSSINQYLNIVFETNNILYIEKWFSLQSLSVTFRNAINTNIKIGRNCMLSYNLELRTGDSHTIYDQNSKKVINSPKNLEIGNHVWIAAGSKILKGSKIPDNCIVGANSIVTKAFEEENCIIAGSPAKVIKTGVNWHKCGPHQWDSYKDFV